MRILGAVLGAILLATVSLSGAQATKLNDVTLTVSPDPVPAGATLTVTGVGFTPGNAVNFVREGVATYARADANGAASTTYLSYDVGIFTIRAKEYVNHRGYLEVASVTYTVQ